MQGGAGEIEQSECQLCGKLPPPVTTSIPIISLAIYRLGEIPSASKDNNQQRPTTQFQGLILPRNFMPKVAFRCDNHEFEVTVRNGACAMKNRTWIGLAAVVLVCAGTFFGYRKWGTSSGTSREELLALMPTDASAVFFADLDELRSAPFLAEIYASAPKPQADTDYAQFVRETGFDYERDLQRVAIATEKRGQDSTLIAIVDGKFDRQKISTYAMKNGSTVKTGGHEILSVVLSGSSKKLSFTFLRNDRIALTNDADLNVFLDAKKRIEDAAEWRTRFERLAGSPLFAVIRQDAAAGAALSAQAPGGLRSPQLSALLDQLQWITLAGRPDNDRLRVAAEGECSAETTARQLADMLNGVVILAQAGLNDAKTRQQLDPTAREAYLELLHSADISKLDRGDTKSVRVLLEITPAILDAARRAPLVNPDFAPAKPLPRKTPASRKGHT